MVAAEIVGTQTRREGEWWGSCLPSRSVSLVAYREPNGSFIDAPLLCSFIPLRLLAIVLSSRFKFRVSRTVKYKVCDRFGAIASSVRMDGNQWKVRRTVRYVDRRIREDFYVRIVDSWNYRTDERSSLGDCNRNRCSKADRKATPRERWCGGGRVNRSTATRCVLVVRGVGESSRHIFFPSIYRWFYEY